MNLRTRSPFFCLLLATLSLSLMACGGDETADKPNADPHAGHNHAHGPKGPNGGEIVKLGEGDDPASLEFVLDHSTEQIVIWLTGKDAKPITASEAPVLHYTEDGAAKTLAATQFTDVASDGSAWIFKSPIFKGDPENAQVKIISAGKTYMASVAHHHH